MPSYKLTFSSDNTLSTIGSYRIVSYEDPFRYITSIDSLTDTVSGEGDGYIVQRSFRWSKDGINWSLWIDYTIGDQSSVTGLTFDKDNYLYIEIKFQIVDDSSPVLEIGTEISPEISITMFDMTATRNTPDPFAGYPGPVRGLCSNEYMIKPIVFQNTQYTFSPYNVNQAVNLYQDLSKMVNNMFGIEVVYYRVVPQRRSRDIVLKEWTVFNVDTEKCIKVVVPNNQFPDSKPTFTPFGIDFEQPFEVHIDKGYWESYFGKGSMPQQRDVLYFPIQNRIYEIQSSYAYRDFMNKALYFKVSLVKYQPKSDTIMSDEIQTTLDNLTLTTEELFAEEFADQVERHTKPQQYVTVTHDSDPIRETVLRTLPVNKYNFYNNWTLVFETYYDMVTAFDDAGVVDAITYRVDSAMTSEANRSYTCWFSPQNNTKNASTTRNLLSGTGTNGDGVNIDLAWTSSSSSQIVLTINGDTYSFIVGGSLEIDSWYGLVVNWSSEFKQASVDIWKTQQNTSQLVRISHETKTINAFSYESGVRYKLKTSPIYLTNVRVYDTMMDQEQQNIMLNQFIVKDSNLAIIVDNAKPLLRLASIAKPK